MVHIGGRAVRRGAVLALAVLCAAVSPRPLHAEDIFTVSGVPVDVTGATAAAAREQALLEGQHKAAQILFRRLALPDDFSKIPTLTDTQLYEAVQGIEVAREKTSTVRYIGDLTVRFKPDAVREILRGADIRYAETVSKPVVIVPVYHTSDANLLWDETNPWFAAWGAHVTKGGLIPFIVPLGDLTDIAAITADEAVQGVLPKLSALAQRYGAADAIVAVAAPAPDESGLDISATRFSGGFQDRTDVMRVAANPGESQDDMMIRAVRTVESQIDANWKQENVLRFGHEEMISVTVPITDLGQWVAMRRKLDSLAFVRNAEVTSISRTRAVVGLHFLGDVGQLKLALAQQDLDLTQDGSAWILQPAHAEAPAYGATATGEAVVPGPGGGETGAAVPQNNPDGMSQPGPETPPAGTSLPPPESSTPDTAAPEAPAAESGY